MRKKKIIRITLLLGLTGILIAGGIALYLFNMPHRDVQSSETDYRVKASTLVSEYLSNTKKADEKYLDEEGDSKIFEIEGVVNEISEDFDNQKVVLLKGSSDKAGVSCTFMKETNKQVQTLKVGDKVIIKGVIRAGATYDPDLEMYENVILEKCALVK